MAEAQESTKDYLVKALCHHGKVRVYAICSTGVVEECRKRHDMWATATAALGRTLSVGSMMGAMLKGDEKLTIQVNGSGPLGRIIVDANGRGGVRGFVDHPHTHFPINEAGKLDVGKAVGKTGHVLIIKDLNMKEPYRGSSPLISGEIGEDFTYYFAQSEQTPSAVGVGVMVNPDHSVKASGGYIIQLLPGVEDAFITYLEKRLAEVLPISQMVDQGYTPEKMVETLFPNEDIQWLDKIPVTFECHCSLERVKQTLISLGEDEIKAMIAEDQQAEVHCHFCNETYHLNEEELQDLITE